MNLSERFAPFKFNATNWHHAEVLCELKSLHINYYRRWNQQRTKKNRFRKLKNWMTQWIRSIRLGPLLVYSMNAWKSLKILFFCYFSTFSSILSSVESMRTNKYFPEHKLKAEKIVDCLECICFHSIASEERLFTCDRWKKREKSFYASLSAPFDAKMFVNVIELIVVHPNWIHFHSRFERGAEKNAAKHIASSGSQQ